MFIYGKSGKAWLHKPCLFLVLGALVCLPLVSHAQSDQRARIDRLENEIETLSRAVFRGERPPTPSASPASGASAGLGAGAGQQAALIVRLDSMEAELRRVTGRLEEQSFEIEQLKNQLADLKNARATAPVSQSPPAVTTDLGQVMAGAAQQPQTPPAAAPSNISSSSANMPSAKPATADEAYESAFVMLQAQNYEAAQSAFETFLETYPEHDLAANAAYWLGETHYVRGEFDQAARIFARAYQDYPEGNKKADNLLKLALSLAGLEKVREACIALEQLEKEFPQGVGPILARGHQEYKRLACTAR